jgi:hypothetical protein
MGSRRAAALSLAVALTAVGCAGIPTRGGVHVGRVLAPAGGVDQVDVRIVPHGPVRGMDPTDVVHGFLRGMVDSDGDYGIARTYLTPRAAESWQSVDVTTYDDSNVRLLLTERTATTRTVQLQAPRVGYIDARGDFTPAVGEMSVSFTLVKQAGQWRIDRLPRGALLSAYDALRSSYRLADVYYLNRAGTSLVPEQVLLPPHGIVTALAKTLIAGPGAWIAPAVRTAFPAGTELLGNVPVDADGTAEVNLSTSVRQATAAQLQSLSAQLVWTLRQVSAISAVRLLADGSPLVVPGAPVSQPRDSWPRFNPAAPPAVSSAVYDDGLRVASVGDPVRGLAEVGQLLSPVMSHDGRLIAGLRAAGRRMQLFVGRLGDAATRRLTATTLTPPTFDPAGDVFTVSTGPAGRRLVEVTAAGAVHIASADPVLLRQPVQQLRISRDGARVAALIGPADAARLFVGRVTQNRDRVRFEGLRSILFGVSDVRGLTWSSASEVLVTAAVPSGHREVLKVDPDGYDGYSLQPVDLGTVVGEPTDVAALGSSMLVVASAVVWERSGDGWRRVAVGGTPAYAD